MVKFWLESSNGHDEVEVPVEQAQAKVDELVAQDKLVTLEMKDGTTEVVSKAPDAAKPADASDDWGGLGGGFAGAKKEKEEKQEQLKTLQAELKKEEAKIAAAAAEKPKVDMKDVEKVTATGKMKGG